VKMPQERVKYRKLPGRRRGFLFGSSVWLGPDHLLLVKSARFREDYKRFYFRDVQAIVTAEASRFHISTRAALVVVAWLGMWIFAIGFGSAAAVLARTASHVEGWLLGAGALLLLAAWACISARLSCRCRIYTAVSSDELPSLYRRWTARRFLEQVQPYITQAQGAIDGNWAEAVEEKQVGPAPEGRVGLSMPGALGSVTMPPAAYAAWTTPVSAFFVGSLSVGGLANLGALRVSAQAGRWILLSSLLVQLGAAVAVMIQCYTGRLRTAMRNLAITALVAIAVWYYAVQIGVGMAVAYQSAQSKSPRMFPRQAQAWTLFEYPLARGSAGGITALLGLAGVVLGLRGERLREEKVSFNV